MENSCFCLEIPRNRLQGVADAITEQLSGGDGVLIPVSSRKALLAAGVAKELGKSVGETKLKSWLRAQGVVDVDKVTGQRAMELMNARESADLPPTEPADCDSDLVVDGYDWHLEETNATRAWQLFPNYKQINWGGLRVGHLDTGFTPHPALNASVNTTLDKNLYPGDFETDTISELTWAGLSADSNSAIDPLGGANGGHGTRTLGVLTGFDENPLAAGNEGCFKGYYGVAPNVPVVPVRLTDSVWITHLLGEALPEAIMYLVERAQCRIISMSLGAPYLGLRNRMPKALARALDFAYSQGVIFVSAAGNNIPNDRVVWPARMPKIIAVAGSTLNKTTWHGSSRGAPVDICAPAYPIRRPKTKRRGANRFSYPGGGKGTSYATPQVAGAAALWLTHHGNGINNAYPKGWQRVEAFRQLLKQTAQTVTGPEADLYGAGLLDVEALLNSQLPDSDTLEIATG